MFSVHEEPLYIWDLPPCCSIIFSALCFDSCIKCSAALHTTLTSNSERLSPPQVPVFPPPPIVLLTSHLLQDSPSSRFSSESWQRPDPRRAGTDLASPCLEAGGGVDGRKRWRWRWGCLVVLLASAKPMSQSRLGFSALNWSPPIFTG